MNNPTTFDKGVLIQGNRTPAPPLAVGLPGGDRWLNAVSPNSSPYTQTLGGGQSNVQVAKTPGTRGAGFAGGAAPSSPFTMTIHGGGKVSMLSASPATPTFGVGQKPYPAPSSNAGIGAPVSAATYHIEGGGAAFINGLAAVSGDVVSWGKHYTPGQPLPAYALRGNPSATTDIVDSPIVIGYGLTMATTDGVHTISVSGATRSLVSTLTDNKQVFNLVNSVTASLTVTTEIITYVTGATFNAASCTIELATATKAVATGVQLESFTYEYGLYTLVTGVTFATTYALAPP